MKVVKKETPQEEVKVTNLFGDEYTPEEELEFICDDCLAEEVDTLKEAVMWLSEDVIDHEDALHMLWEKLQNIEDNQLTDIANLSDAIDIMDCMQKASRMMLDVIIEQWKEIKGLSSSNTSLVWLLCVNLVWIAVLTVLFWIYVF